MLTHLLHLNPPLNLPIPPNLSLALPVSVTHPVSGLPSARHLRSASDYIDSHTTQTSTCHHGLHFPCSISLITFTPAANYRHYRMMSPEVAANAAGPPKVVLLAAVLPQAMVTSVASSEVAVYAAEHPEAKVLASAPCARW